MKDSFNAAARTAALRTRQTGADKAAELITSQARSLRARQLLATCELWPLVIAARILGLALLLMSVDTPTLSASGAFFLLLGLGLDTTTLASARMHQLRRILARNANIALGCAISVSCFCYAYGLMSLVDGPVPIGAPVAMASLAAVTMVVIGILGQQRYHQCYAIVATAAGTAIIFDSVAMLAAAFCFVPMLYVAGRRSAADEQDLLKAEIEERRQFNRASMMIRDYEMSGRGWFWETDRHGTIIYISEKALSLIGLSSEQVLGQKLGSIAAESNDGVDVGQRTLNFHLSARTAFSDLGVRLAITTDERWWSLSGTPFFSEYGHFKGFRGHGTDLTEDRKSHQAVAKMARYDTLTGLANRRHIKDLFQKALVDHRGQNKPCSVFLVDLDRFKQVNDTLGHAVGDALLKQVAERLKRTIGEQAEVGRLGGDEFQVVLPGIISADHLTTIAKAVISNLTHAYMVEGNQIVIGASLGIAIAEGRSDDKADTLLRNADLALYAAKEAGRGVYRFYHSDLHKTARDKRILEDELRKALEQGGLKVNYQPIVNVASETITGFEALARWTHPQLGAIGPDRFIAIAEDAGLIGALGEWVLRTACADAAAWPDHIRVAVNVSPHQFADPAFPAVVINALTQNRMNPERLELEVTENVYLNGDIDTDAVFKRLKKIGVRLALDDFGTGYSALSYIKRAPFDKIKIDKSFVRGAADAKGTNSAIIRSIVTLAEALSMETTAEGAETLDELELVRSLGCSHVQGYVYSRPMSADDAKALIASHGGLAVAQGFSKSRSQRYRVLRTIEIDLGGMQYRAKVRNISTGGALIEGIWDLQIGTRMAIRLASNLLIQADVRWSQDDWAGVQFAEPIDIATFHASTPLASEFSRSSFRKVG